MTDDSKPRGDLTVRIIAMPADTNANGDIFGGWVMAHMDQAGGIAGVERAQGRVVTIAVEAMTFIRPVKVGDVLEVYTEVESVGRTSMKIHVEAWAQRFQTHHRDKVTDAMFTFVAIDDRQAAADPEGGKLMEVDVLRSPRAVQREAVHRRRGVQPLGTVNKLDQVCGAVAYAAPRRDKTARYSSPPTMRKVAHRAVAERLERLLVGRAVVGGDRLLDAREFGDDDALLLPRLVGVRRGAACQIFAAERPRRLGRQLGVFGELRRIGNRAVDRDPVAFGHCELPLTRRT